MIRYRPSTHSKAWPWKRSRPSRQDRTNSRKGKLNLSPLLTRTILLTIYTFDRPSRPLAWTRDSRRRTSHKRSTRSPPSSKTTNRAKPSQIPRSSESSSGHWVSNYVVSRIYFCVTRACTSCQWWVCLRLFASCYRLWHWEEAGGAEKGVIWPLRSHCIVYVLSPAFCYLFLWHHRG